MQSELRKRERASERELKVGRYGSEDKNRITVPGGHNSERPQFVRDSARCWRAADCHARSHGGTASFSLSASNWTSRQPVQPLAPERRFVSPPQRTTSWRLRLRRLLPT